ncbi:MAG: DUF3822 family protein [Cytophagaceae bacterium]|nr:DUF3822 family protein [Cytophagaceae bacterium]
MSGKTREIFKLNQSIKDERFNVDHISQYNLSLQISIDLFRICITDSTNNRCLLVEDYQFPGLRQVSQLTEQLELIYDDHTLLQAGYWKSIKLCIKNKHFSLIPNALFDKEYLNEYLKLNSAIHPQQVYYHKQSTMDAVNIFAAEKELVEWFNFKYPQKAIKVIHYTSPFIEGIMINESGKEDRSVYIVAEKDYMAIIVKHNRKLEFCNNFNYKTPEDFLYFVMFVFDQLKLNPEINQVTLWGEINTDSPVYNKLYKYIRNITFGNKPASLSFGYQFDEVFDHKYYDLYNIHFCE